MMKKTILMLLVLLTLTSAQAQDIAPLADASSSTDSPRPASPGAWHVEYGVRGGFVSTITHISSFSIDGATISNPSTTSGVGEKATAFMRLSSGIHCLSAEFGFTHAVGHISFPTSDWYLSAKTGDKSIITTHLNMLELPLAYGVFIKKTSNSTITFNLGPKASFIMCGKSSQLYENFSQADIVETINPIRLSAVGGFTVTVGNLRCDLEFDSGLHNFSRHFTTFDDDGNNAGPFIYNRRHDMLSFTIGVIF